MNGCSNTILPKGFNGFGPFIVAILRCWVKLLRVLMALFFTNTAPDKMAEDVYTVSRQWECYNKLYFCLNCFSFTM